jgi:hypothetical protein
LRRDRGAWWRRPRSRSYAAPCCWHRKRSPSSAIRNRTASSSPAIPKYGMPNDRGRGDDDTKSEKQAAAGGHGWKRFQRFRARGSSRNQMRRRSDQFPLAGGAAPLMGSPNLDAHDIASRCNSPHRLASRQDTKAPKAARIIRNKSDARPPQILPQVPRRRGGNFLEVGVGGFARWVG